MGMRLLRIFICVLLALAVQAAFSTDREPEEALYPADGLHYLTTANSLDRSPRTGRRYGSLAGMRKFASLIKPNAAKLGLDWRLLGAVIFHESQFDHEALSGRDAKGLMQVRDVTAVQYGFPTDSLFNPETNIALGALLLGDLIDSFREEGLDSADVVRFALASYNVGGGALAKRREEAAAEGLDPNRWDDVADIFRRTSNITPDYILAVEDTYAYYCESVPE